MVMNFFIYDYGTTRDKYKKAKIPFQVHINLGPFDLMGGGVEIRVKNYIVLMCFSFAKKKDKLNIYAKTKGIYTYYVFIYGYFNLFQNYRQNVELRSENEGVNVGGPPPPLNDDIWIFRDEKVFCGRDFLGKGCHKFFL